MEGEEINQVENLKKAVEALGKGVLLSSNPA